MTLNDYIEKASEELLEKCADLEHERWSGWMKYMISRMNLTKEGKLEFDEEDFSRWSRQMTTSYTELSEKEKESDRKEVQKYLPLLRTAIINAVQEYAEYIRLDIKSSNSSDRGDMIAGGNDDGWNAAIDSIAKKHDEYMKGIV